MGSGEWRDLPLAGFFFHSLSISFLDFFFSLRAVDPNRWKSPVVAFSLTSAFCCCLKEMKVRESVIVLLPPPGFTNFIVRRPWRRNALSRFCFLFSLSLSFLLSSLFYFPKLFPQRSWFPRRSPLAFLWQL